MNLQGWRIFRYAVPVDGEWHHIDLRQGEIVHVDSRRPDVVEFWATNDPAADVQERTFQVFGTGHLINAPGGVLHYRGTTLAANGAVVWHLIERTAS